YFLAPEMNAAVSDWYPLVTASFPAVTAGSALNKVYFCTKKKYDFLNDVEQNYSWHVVSLKIIMNNVFYSYSITLGGFGADRFYLGQWREGLGKLFSFGGLGIWTLIDVLLIGVGYVGPADGSFQNVFIRSRLSCVSVTGTVHKLTKEGLQYNPRVYPLRTL
uniref:TM2 domain-containing protein 3 n=1 Tax=Amazona collaria TaxID=241587 RepID=A0A8B9GJG5_9PSIT